MSILGQPLQNIFIKPSRTVGSDADTIAVQVVVNEAATDVLTVTKQPVQQGASVSDHAYMEPTVFSHTIYFASAGLFGGQTLAQVYAHLLRLQTSRVPLTIVTPKRKYTSYLMTALSQTTDKLTENCLAIHATYQQIILVAVQATTVPRIDQKSPQTTAGTQNTGNKNSVLYNITGGT